MENQLTTINLAFICLLFVRFVCAFFLYLSLSSYFAVLFAQMSEGARWCAKYTSTKKATQDNNTKVQSSSSPSLSQEFVQSTKYTRSQFTAFICRLKWCQSILNSAQRGRVKNRKWQWVFGNTAVQHLEHPSNILSISKNIVNSFDDSNRAKNKRMKSVLRMLPGPLKMWTIRIAILVWLFLSLQRCVSASFPFRFFSLPDPRHFAVCHLCHTRQCQCKLCARRIWRKKTNAGTD